jgi:excisionase family DNA binding protein
MSQPENFDAERPVDTLLLKAEEVAKLLGMGRTKVYEMMGAGELPVVRIGSAVRVPRQRLLDWIEEHTEKAA